MLDNANDVQTPRNESSTSYFAELDRLLVDPMYGAAELVREWYESGTRVVREW